MDEKITQRANVRAIRFYQVPHQNEDGSYRYVDWVEYAALGNAKYLTTPDAVSRVQKLTDGTWDCLKPAYEAWKAGQEIPLNGTPLSAWSGVNPQQADILKARDIKTIEDVAEMTDAHMSKIGIPDIRYLRDQAKAWVASKDTRKIEAEMANKDEQIAFLTEQMAEMQAQMAALAGEEAPKRRGRPPKVQEAA